MSSPHSLYHFEPTSGTWLYVKECIAEMLMQARAELEAEDTPEARTNALRARIATLKTIVSLEESRPTITEGDSYT